MEKKMEHQMETGIYRDYVGDNGKENGNYYNGELTGKGNGR